MNLPAMKSWRLEEFDPNLHDVQAFDCGTPDLNQFLHDQAAIPSDELQHYDIMTYVVVSQTGSREILAYAS
jgi:hypothetical protein